MEAVETVLTTERLALRRLSDGDAEFIVALLNEPSFIQNVGDKGVRDASAACAYIANGPVASYERNGFGLWAVTLRDSAAPIGICGLLKRDSLDDVDIGFAFLPAHWSRGYAVESAMAVKKYARDVLGLARLVAITVSDNHGSIRVLEKIGLRFETLVHLTDDGPELKLFAAELAP